MTDVFGAERFVRISLPVDGFRVAYRRVLQDRVRNRRPSGVDTQGGLGSPNFLTPGVREGGILADLTFRVSEPTTRE